jgi:hypothetical protein
MATENNLTWAETSQRAILWKMGENRHDQVIVGTISYGSEGEYEFLYYGKPGPDYLATARGTETTMERAKARLLAHVALDGAAAL